MRPIHYLAGFAWANFYAMCWVVVIFQGEVPSNPWRGFGLAVFFFAMAFTLSMVATGKKDK